SGPSGSAPGTCTGSIPSRRTPGTPATRSSRNTAGTATRWWNAGISGSSRNSWRLSISPAADDVPVMLVHGFASSYERNWREPGWADLLRDEDRQVIGVDLLGHGQAARPRDPAAYSSLERSVLTAMPGT